jgi:hypothetical protein
MMVPACVRYRSVDKEAEGGLDMFFLFFFSLFRDALTTFFFVLFWQLTKIKKK